MFYQQTVTVVKGAAHSVHCSLLWEASRSRETDWRWLPLSTVHRSTSLFVSNGRTESGEERSAVNLQEGGEALLFKFQGPDMLRPTRPPFTLLIARWRGGRWRGGGGGCLWDLHLRRKGNCSYLNENKQITTQTRNMIWYRDPRWGPAVQQAAVCSESCRLHLCYHFPAGVLRLFVHTPGHFWNISLPDFLRTC